MKQKPQNYIPDRGDFVWISLSPTAGGDGSSGVVLADHLRNVDWRARNVQFIHRVSDFELSEVVARIDALLVSPDV